jgi:SEC-C motif
VKVARNDPCPCGSGRKYKLCHGTRLAVTEAESQKLLALGEAHDLAALFPFVRPVGDEIAKLVEHAAREGTVGPEAVDEGRALLDAAERRRLVDSYADRYPDRWAALVAAAGSGEIAERALVTGAVRAAIAERLLPPRGVLEEVERQTDALDTPAKILLFLLSPANVWSIEDVISAEEEASEFEPRSPEWLAAVDVVARERLDSWHVERVRVLADHLEAWLPIDRLPRISAALAEARDEVHEDDALAAEIATFSLTNFLVRLRAEHALRLSLN